MRLLGPVRLRTTLAATVVVAIALAFGAFVLVRFLRGSLEQNRESVAAAQAVDIAGLAGSGRLPTTLGSPSEDTTLSQVVDQHNRVVAASANIDGEAPVGNFSPLGSSHVVRHLQTMEATDGGPSLLYALGAELGGRPVTVFTAVSLDATDQAVRTVIVDLAFGLPLLLLLVAAMTWVIVGRALRPIDAIRAEVAEITNHDLHRRVPEPAVHDEVGRLAQTMNSMLERLEASSERQRRFVADASHELRSPLTAIRAALEVGLAQGNATDWSSTAADILLDEGRLERLVTELLVLARLEADRDPSPTESTDLAKIVTDDLRVRTERPGIVVRSEATGGTQARISTPRARQVVVNLVDNAQRHARREVVVTVVADGDGTVELVVTDDGPGIAPGDRQAVFERFTRLDEARSDNYGGAGLGLAIVRDIVSRHHGSVAFTDAAIGARVVVVLPTTASPANDQDRP